MTEKPNQSDCSDWGEDEQIEDVRELLEDNKPKITEIFPFKHSSKNYPKNLEKIWDEFIWLPESHIQKIPILTYALSPLTFLDSCPILCLYGQSGSGKSAHSELMGNLWGVPLLTQESTVSGLRNAINDRRFPLPELELDWDELQRLRFLRKNETSSLIVFEDLSLEHFFDDRFYSLLKSGCYRTTDRIELSGGMGKNMVFYTFIPKVLSTVYPIFGDGVLQTNELQRRLMVCFHDKPEENSYPSRKLSHYDFSELGELTQKFWKSRSKILGFREIRTLVRDEKKPKSIPNEYWQLWEGLICISLLLGFYQNVEECFYGWEQYYAFLKSLRENTKSNLLELIAKFIKEKEEKGASWESFLGSLKPKKMTEVMSRYKELKEQGIYDDEEIKNFLTSVSIPSQELSSKISQWSSLNLFKRPSSQQQEDIMKSHGYLLNPETLNYEKA